MLASLGKGFRKKARKGRVAAFVVRGNKDGSLKLTQARVLTVRGVGAALIHIPLSLAVGFLGLVSWLKGGWRFAHSVHVRQGHVGSDEQVAHAMLARAGAHGALALICCDDAETRGMVVARASDLGSESWDRSRTEFLAALDPGSKDDWVRAALGEPLSS